MFDFEDEYVVIYGNEDDDDYEEEEFYDYDKALKYAESLKNTYPHLTVFLKEITFSEI